MSNKLTTVEKRAKNYCDHLNEYNGGRIEVNWKKSRTWGMNPVITDYSGDKCTNVSGCGYCKLSTALADCLCFLFPVGSENYKRVAYTAGTGESSFIHAMQESGWHVDKVYANENTDVYDLKRIENSK